MPQKHLTDKTDKRHRIPVDKEAVKACEEELVKLVTDCCNEKLNAGYAADCERMVRKLGCKRNKPLTRCGLKILAVTILDWKALLYGGTVATVPPLNILAHGLNCVSACGESGGNARTQVNSGVSWKRARVSSRNPSKRSGGLPVNQ